MPMTYVWIALTILFVILEMATPQLITIWFAAGSAVALLLAALDLPLWLQIAAFAVVSLCLLFALRPLARKLNHTAEKINADRVIGRVGVVTECVDNLAAQGQVRIDGQIWTARAETDEPIPPETRVTVLRLEGVKVIVTPAE